MADGFFATLNESEAGKLLEFGSRLGGTYTFLSGVISLVQESDTDKILDAIEQLRQEMNRNFQELSEFIARQTQIIVDEVRLTATATALSHSDTGFNQLKRYLDTSDLDALQFAENESSLGVEFFTNLGTSPDPSFLPGILKAGTIRLLVVASEPMDFRSTGAIMAQVREMVDILGAMLESIRERVTGSHRISQQSHTRRCRSGVDDR